MSASRGVAAFSKKVQELRFVMCQTSPASAGMRAFVKSNYAEIKKNNASLPVLIREANGVLPRMTARFEFGEEAEKQCENLTEEQILASLQELTKR